MLIDCPAVLKKAPMDSVMPCRVRVWVMALVAVSWRAAWVRSWMGWFSTLEAVNVLAECASSCSGWVMALVAVSLLDTLEKNWTVSDRALCIVHCRVASTRIPRVCWTDLMKLPVDCARACTIRVWAGALVAVNCLMVWVMSCRGCDRLLVAVSCLDVSVAILRTCWADLRKVPIDWARVCKASDCVGSLMAVHCLEKIACSWRG